VPVASVPEGSIIDSPEAKIGLRGSLVRNFLDTGSTVSATDILRPRDRGFLASVLAPGSRAVSIAVDEVSGVSGLIWPGDQVDVILTHDIENADAAHKTLSETILSNVRVIGIDQGIVQGVPANPGAAGKIARTATLQVAPSDVERITVAEHIGKLTLAIRSATETAGGLNTTGTFGGDVSSALAGNGQITTVTVLDSSNGSAKGYPFKTGVK
jgi:pilus assembly protein CpaB